jgi:hypothetical protein
LKCNSLKEEKFRSAGILPKNRRNMIWSNE